ncbi:MAG: hypothetical protein IPH31_14055 [Lewinellaceae bacterium]|nr:hypothetical protein [Lewinellaceae bacterium]
MGVFGKHLFQNDSAMDSIESLKSAGIEKFLSSLLKVGDNESDDSGPYDFEVDDLEPYDFEVDDFEVDDFELPAYGRIWLL